MADDTRRLNGTLFWLGQYTVRNERFIELNEKLYSYAERLTQDDADSLGVDLERLIEWAHDIVGTAGSSVEVALDCATLEWFGFSIDGENSAQLPDRIKTIIQEARAAHRELDSNFPCLPEDYDDQKDPYEILQSILKNDFPPITERIEMHGRYSETIVSPICFDRDVLGDEIIKITNHRVDTAVILEEIRKHVAKQKAVSGIQDDFPSLMPVIEKRLAKKYRSSDESRAIGLLLYDYRNEFTCSDAEYVRIIKDALKEDLKKKGLRPGKEDSGQRQYEDWLARTKKCIEKAEVLEM